MMSSPPVATTLQSPSPVLIISATFLYLAAAAAILFAVHVGKPDISRRSQTFVRNWRYDERFWMIVVALIVICMAYRATGLENLLQKWLRDQLRADGLYTTRRQLQSMFIVGGMVVGVALLGLTSWYLRHRHPSIRLAAVSGLILLMTLGTRAASQHGFDGLFQASIAGVKLSWMIEASLLAILTGCAFWFRHWRSGLKRRASDTSST